MPPLKTFTFLSEYSAYVVVATDARRATDRLTAYLMTEGTTWLWHREYQPEEGTEAHIAGCTNTVVLISRI